MVWETMPEDLYKKILNIPDRDGPPNYYVLLDIKLFETNGKVIHSAGLKQISKLKEWQLHTDPAISNAVQEMMNEISKVCSILENPVKKEEYDRELAKELDIDLDKGGSYTTLTIQTEMMDCPNCGSIVSLVAEVCYMCRYNFQLKEVMPLPEKPPEPKDPLINWSTLMRKFSFKEIAVPLLITLLIVFVGLVVPYWIINRPERILKNKKELRKKRSEFGQDWHDYLKVLKAEDIPENAKREKWNALCSKWKVDSRGIDIYSGYLYWDSKRNCVKNISKPISGSNWTIPDLRMKFIWIKELNCWVGKYEVTNGEYRKFNANHKSRKFNGYNLNEDRQPAVNISYKDAAAFARWLTREWKIGIPRGMSYRLPDGDEWTTFAQCGDDRKYPWGNSWPPKYGNYSDKSSAWEDIISGYNDGYALTCPVEKSGKNDWNLYGVGGNVWEWTDELEDDSIYIARGGSWQSNVENQLDCTNQHSLYSLSENYDIGFRLILSR